MSYDDWKLATPPEYEEGEVDEDKRSYNRPIPDYADVMTLAEWEEAVEHGSFVEYDGSGYWCKDGKESSDSVWDTDCEDATHVAWYNK